FVCSSGLSNIHWPLHIAYQDVLVNTNRIIFSHYYSRAKIALSKSASSTHFVWNCPENRGSWAKNFVDIHDFDLLAELLPVDPITISQQIFRCGVERKGFQHLLRGPFSRGMSRDVEVDNASSIVGENDKHEQNFKPHGV